MKLEPAYQYFQDMGYTQCLVTEPGETYASIACMLRFVTSPNSELYLVRLHDTQRLASVEALAQRLITPTPLEKN